SVERKFEAGLEEKGQIRQRREVVQAAHPFRGATADRIARVGSKDVTIAKDEVTRAQQRNQMTLVTIRKIGRVNQAERSGGKQFPLLAFAGGGFDDLRGVPFAEIDLVPLQFQPAFEQINLG